MEYAAAVVPSFFALIVVAVGFLSTPVTAIAWQVTFCLFAAASAVELTALGGAPLTPSVCFLPFLMYRAFRSARERFDFSQVDAPSFWLLATVTWGFVGAFFWPRFLEGDIWVYGVDRLSGSGSVTLMTLRPTSGNITQPVYAAGSAIAYLSMRALLRRSNALEAFGKAALGLGALDCAAAFLNLGEFYAGVPPMLQYVRTAKYAMFAAYEEGGLMRIQGTFAETSGFASFSMPLFAFALSLWLLKYETKRAGWVAGTLLALLLLSTSGTAYVSMSLYMSTIAARLIWRAAANGKIPHLHLISLLLIGGAALLLAQFVFETGVAAGIERAVEHFIFGKMSSRSGQERSDWNLAGWDAFVDTYGLGVGLGSTRASSWFIAILSSLGLPGVFLFGLFLRSVFRNRVPPGQELHPIAQAARQSMICALLTASVSGANFDLGVLFYSFAAAASTLRVSPASATVFAPVASGHEALAT